MALGLAPPPGTIEEIIKVVVTVFPVIEEVPVIGQIIKTLLPGGGDDFALQEQLQRQADKKKTERQTRTDRNARYVLKASDAMKCVEENLMKGGALLSLAKGIMDWALTGKNGPGNPDVLLDKIFACIESKELKQTGKRKKKTAPYFGRPARGHGKKKIPVGKPK